MCERKINTMNKACLFMFFIHIFFFLCVEKCVLYRELTVHNNSCIAYKHDSICVELKKGRLGKDVN